MNRRNALKVAAASAVGLVIQPSQGVGAARKSVVERKRNLAVFCIPTEEWRALRKQLWTTWPVDSQERPGVYRMGIPEGNMEKALGLPNDCVIDAEDSSMFFACDEVAVRVVCPRFPVVGALFNNVFKSAASMIAFLQRHPLPWGHPEYNLTVEDIFQGCGPEERT